MVGSTILPCPRRTSKNDSDLHVCSQVLPNGSVCGAYFASFRVLQSHRRMAKYHSFVAPDNYLAVTNQTTQATMTHIRRHIKRSLAKRLCRVVVRAALSLCQSTRWIAPNAVCRVTVCVNFRTL